MKFVMLVTHDDYDHIIINWRTAFAFIQSFLEESESSQIVFENVKLSCFDLHLSQRM